MGRLISVDCSLTAFFNGGSFPKTVLWPLENHSVSPFLEGGGEAGT